MTRGIETKHGRGWRWGTIVMAWAWLCLGLQAVDLPVRWRWSNPTPHGGNVYDMTYGLGLTVQVAERGQIYTSEDLSFWTPRESGTTNTLLATAFFGNRLLAAGENGTILWADSLEQFNLVGQATTDWLLGLAASSSLVVAVGDNGAIYESETGTNGWTRVTMTGQGATTWLRSVANNGNIFVAVGENGFISVRGANGTWAPPNGGSGTTQHLNRVAFVNNNEFWAVGENGTILKGNNQGKSWVPVTGLSITNTLYAVAGSNGTVVVAGERAVYLQENGSWTNQILSSSGYPAPSWTYYSALWEGSLYFLAGRSGMMVEGFETNGPPMLWVTRNDPIRSWLWDIMSTPDFYVTVGDHGTVMTSEDGVNWNLELVPNSVTNSILLGVGGSTNGLVAVGNKGSIIYSPNVVTNIVSTNTVNLVTTVITNAVSTVGVVWNPVPAPTGNDLQGVAVYGNLYVVSGAGGTILTSEDGVNWSARATPTNTFLSSVAATASGLVATGDRGTILTSANGTDWVSRSSGTTNWIYRVRWLNGLLVAVGENGIILTSANDGANWTLQTSGTTKWLNGVDYISGVYVAVGNQGTVLISTNATAWTNIGTATQKALYGVAGNNGQVVTAGIEGVALRSPFTPRTNAVSFVNFTRASGQNLLLISGKTDQKFMLQRSPNLTNWTDGITLEFVDRSGTLLFLENSDTNNLPMEFYRAMVVP
jgi:photosystem II stability/assembly factor-like uncharacterized protein